MVGIKGPIRREPIVVYTTLRICELFALGKLALGHADGCQVTSAPMQNVFVENDVVQAGNVLLLPKPFARRSKSMTTIIPIM